MPFFATVVYLLIATKPAPTPHTPASAQDAQRSISEVWLRESDYWRFVKAGDVEHYVALWHDHFIGWPCGQSHPKRKAGIGDWVREVREKHLSVSYQLTQEGAEAFDDVVVTHYTFTRVDTYPDGHVEGEGKVSKITHTWLRVHDTWLIIGGMCGDLSDTAK